MYLFFDTETSGLPKNFNAPYTDMDNWPRLVQLAYCVADEDGKVIESNSVIIKPNGFKIPTQASDIHNITTARAMKEGIDLFEALNLFSEAIEDVDLVIAHNYSFDSNVIGAEFHRNALENSLIFYEEFCTMKDPDIIDWVAAEPMMYDRYKWPTLTELYHKCFGTTFNSAHDAAADVIALKECFFFMRNNGIIEFL